MEIFRDNYTRIKNDRREFLFNVFYNFRLLFLSALATFIALYVWSHFRESIYNAFGLDGKIIHANELGSGLIVCVSVLIFGGVYRSVISSVIQKNIRIKAAIQTLNAKMFLEERDRRINYSTHFLMFLISFTTIMFMILFPYSTVKVGYFVVGSSIFLSVYAFLHSIELDNPFRGVSRIKPDKIPKGWMQMNIHDIINGKVENLANGIYTNPNKEKTI